MNPTVTAFISDLIFRTKITSTAATLGAKVAVVTSADQLRDTLAAGGTRLLVVDLNADGQPIEAIRVARGTAAAVRIVAFASHAQSGLMDAARLAGADEVMARSAFTQRLPEILRSAIAAESRAAQGELAFETPTQPQTAADVRCPRCGAKPLSQMHCKVSCEQCGYVESCEDLCLTQPPENPAKADAK